MMMTVLPTPAPPNRPIFPPCDVGLEKVDDLDAGLEHLRRGSRVSNGGRVAVDLPAVVDRADVVGVERLADDVEDVAEDGVADRDGDAAAGVAHRCAPLRGRRSA